MITFGEFLGSYFLWRDPMIVGAAAGAICGLLGVYVVLRRIIFVSAALTQVSSFGVALSFYIEGLGLGTLSAAVHPFALSIALTVAAAVFFALKKDYSRVSREGIIGFGFLIASAAVVILGDRITKGSHDIASILFGSAVVVDPADVYIIPGIAVAAGAVLLFYMKDFIFISFDEESARLFKYPVGALNAGLMVMIAIVAAAATRALGALPVFAFLALPPLAALYFTERLKLAFILSAAMGVLSAVLGYFFSFILSLPTGASMAMCACLFFIAGLLWREVRKRV